MRLSGQRSFTIEKIVNGTGNSYIPTMPAYAGGP